MVLKVVNRNNLLGEISRLLPKPLGIVIVHRASGVSKPRGLNLPVVWHKVSPGLLGLIILCALRALMARTASRTLVTSSRPYVVLNKYVPSRRPQCLLTWI